MIIAIPTGVKVLVGLQHFGVVYLNVQRIIICHWIYYVIHNWRLTGIVLANAV